MRGSGRLTTACSGRRCAPPLMLNVIPNKKYHRGAVLNDCSAEDINSTTLQSFKLFMERSEYIQFLLFWIIILFPLISVFLRKRGRKFLYSGVLVQFAVYILYEIGMVANSPMRFFDMAPIVISILINGFLALWYTRPPDSN